MELILDSSDVEKIKELNDLLSITGVTTNPTIITKSGKKVETLIKELCDILSEDQLLFVQEPIMKESWKRQKRFLLCGKRISWLRSRLHMMV